MELQRIETARQAPLHRASNAGAPLLDELPKRRPYGFLSRMGDEQLVTHAQEVVDRRGISCLKELSQKDRGIYQELCYRGLTARIGFPPRRPRLAEIRAMSRDELVAYGQGLVDEKRIRTASALHLEHDALWRVLRDNGLLETMRFCTQPAHQRGWQMFDNAMLLLYAKGVVSKNGLQNKCSLQKFDNCLYWVLYARKEGGKRLLYLLEFPETRRSFAQMGEGALTRYAQWRIDENGFESRVALQRGDQALYNVLLARELLGRLKFEKSRNDWTRFSDSQLLAYTHQLVVELKIKNKEGVKKENAGLHDTLRSRKLLQQVRPGDDAQQPLGPMPQDSSYTPKVRAMLDAILPGAESYAEKAARLAASIDIHRKKRLEKIKETLAEAPACQRDEHGQCQQ